MPSFVAAGRTPGRAALLLLSFFAALLLSACEKKAGLEGHITDERGQPIPAVRVTALQDSPVSGYDHLEAETDAQGRFSFSRLFPQAAYTLIINAESTGRRQLAVKTGKNRQTTVLSSPVIFRFVFSSDMVVTDTRSGLQWAPDPDILVSWKQAKTYVRSLKLGGYSDWRMPTRAELRSLDGIDSTFPLNDCCVWTAEAKDDQKAWYYNVYRHFDDAAYIHNNSYRVLAVRTAGR